MRGTIIGVFSVVVLIVSVLSFALMRASIGDLSNKGVSQRAVGAAVAKLQVEGLRIERWLARQSNEQTSREPFEAGGEKARQEAATTAANSIEERTKRSPAFATVRPTLVVFFDATGEVLGRNGSALMRGDMLGNRYPRMLSAILAGQTGSDVWIDKSHNEQLLASFAPIRHAGKIVGGVAIGTAFNNERLQGNLDHSGQLGLVAAHGDDELSAIAQTSSVSSEMLGALPSAKQALSTDQVVGLNGLPSGFEGAAQALGGYGDGKQAVIVAVAKNQAVGQLGSLIWPLLGVFLLGLVLTGVCAYLLDNYVSQPISDLEDGLLAIINGQTDLRFELEHKVLGGLVFRINSLLNQLLDVPEDDTDDEGRPSTSPSSVSFEAALNVDERMVSLDANDVAEAAELRAEAPEDYYKRVFDAYLAAKSSLGDPTDNIKFAGFIGRLQRSERSLQQRHGRPFRYRVELKGREVVLVAVPLA